MDLERVFCEVDDFCQAFEPQWNQQLLHSDERKRRKTSNLSLSEVMTIIIAFHRSNYRTFKPYYTGYVAKYWRGAFPMRVGYPRFVELMGAALIPLCSDLHTRKGQVSGIGFIDSTPIIVCHRQRAPTHQRFKKKAHWGKHSMGGCYGFKLHLIINDEGELLAFHVTPGNIDDRHPVPHLTEGLSGKLFGDKGYISTHLFQVLFEKGLQLITPIRKNMHNRLLPLFDKLLLRRRSLIETINDPLKNISQIEHSRHRSIAHFMANLVAGLIAYTHQPLKPSLNLTNQQLILLDKPM
ncbi:IS982 family transposase [Nitrosococcus wardiae]|uniref:IS982 family transposase n=1 Tax=Nitrosococcus wardiae TaxID=1814290 RepID=A0A4P7C1W0_9GAMM|nr:IS982 family transposase [Nitrosococcus wardiae]QBQ56598.1 IS982 family transposase [Nitrosococcus wardiae]